MIILIHTHANNLGVQYQTHGAILGVLGLDESYVVPLQHDPAKLLLSVPFGVHLWGVVQHQVHVLVESRDVTLDSEHWTIRSGCIVASLKKTPCVDILIEPDRDPCPVLEVAEDEVDGLDHHLLNFLAATVAHLNSQLEPLKVTTFV